MRSKSKIPKSPRLLCLDSALQWNDGVKSGCELKEVRSDGGADEREPLGLSDKRKERE